MMENPRNILNIAELGVEKLVNNEHKSTSSQRFFITF